MKKIVVAGIALLAVGAVAYAGVRIGVYGVCPLTGAPLPCSKSTFCPPTAGSPVSAHDGAAANAGGVAAAAADVAAPETPCAQKRKHCRDSQAGDCRTKAQVERQPEPAPQPATNP